MENKRVLPAARTGRSRGLRHRRVFGILSAMGLMSATALIGAERFSNSFVTVEGDGVRIADDGSIHFPNAKSPVAVEVTARPGWKVNGSESVSFTRAPGDGGPLLVTCDLGEGSYCIPLVDCQFGNDVSNRHVAPPAISIEGSERLIYMYALPGSNVLVSASASCETLSNGVHEIVTKWLPCPGCHALHDPAEETNTVSVVPEIGLWTASGAGVTTNASTWTAEMSKGKGQEITFRVDATNDCAECRNNCHASTNVVVDVYELSVTNDLYIGIARTDAGRTNLFANAKTATALIAPAPSGEGSYSWKNCGICSFTGRTDQATVRYFASDPDAGSASHLAEPLTVEATVEDGGLTASATCTTNFTVVKVDVAIANVGEDKEETEGAFVLYVPDTNGLITVEGTNQMKKVAVTFSCAPTNLPTNEVVTIRNSGPGQFYEEAGGELVLITATNYPACELSSHKFFLHGHGVSGSCRDGLIEIGHLTSGAKDIAKYTCFSVQFITPAGDPVNSPVVSGEGQNEFTFSSGNPGELVMNLKARVSPASIAAIICTNLAFAVDAVGNSAMAWDAIAPNGRPAVSGGDLTAKVTFTGMPHNNGDFGRKTAKLLWRGNPCAESAYEVFFDKSATNHPDGQAGSPNWYHYWAGEAVPGYELSSGRYSFACGNLNDYAVYNGDPINPHYTIHGPASAGAEQYSSAGLVVDRRGIDTCAATIRHEKQHRQTDLDWLPGGAWYMKLDTDGDELPDDWEDSHAGFNKHNAYSFSPPFVYGDDEEVWCEMNALNERGCYDKDWANPGKQSHNPY